MTGEESFFYHAKLFWIQNEQSFIQALSISDYIDFHRS